MTSVFTGSVPSKATRGMLNAMDFLDSLIRQKQTLLQVSWFPCAAAGVQKIFVWIFASYTNQPQMLGKKRQKGAGLLANRGGSLNRNRKGLF